MSSGRGWGNKGCVIGVGWGSLGSGETEGNCTSQPGPSINQSINQSINEK